MSSGTDWDDGVQEYRSLQFRVLESMKHAEPGIFFWGSFGFAAVVCALFVQGFWAYQIALSAYALWGLSAWYAASRATRYAEMLMWHDITLREEEGRAFQLWCDLTSGFAAKSTGFVWHIPSFVSLGLFYPILLGTQALFGDAGFWGWCVFVWAAIIIGFLGEHPTKNLMRKSFSRFRARLTELEQSGN